MRQLFLLLACLFPLSLLAQTGSLHLRVLDAGSKESLEFATVTLKSGQNNAKIYGAKTNAQGHANIEAIPVGTYTLSISSIGYESNNMPNVNIKAGMNELGTINLKNTSRNLKDVTIKGEKAQMEIGVDKKTFNVDKNITSAGGTAADILRNVPSVNVDPDGNLSVRGKENVTLLVDGKPSAMFGNDVATALNTIPAASIEQVEVITNPSSKYEAQGMNGIVNIILKKDRKPGYNGMLTLGAAYPFRVNAGVNMNANVKKWNLFFNGNTRTSKTWEETTNVRDDYNNPTRNASFIHNDRRPLSYFANAGAEYNIDNKNKITLTQSIYTAYMKGNSLNTIENTYQDTLVSRTVRANQYTGNPLNGTTNLQYRHTFKDPKEDINFEINFSKSRYKRESDFQTTTYNNINEISNQFNQSNPVLGGNWNGTFVVDYTKPLGKTGKLEMGERSYLIQFKSENQPRIQYAGSNETEETKLKNHFVFQQQVHGVYTNVANTFGKTTVQMGLRGELFAYNGTVYQYNTSAKDQYISLFPTLFVGRKLNKTQDLNFSYSRRVNRPNFFQLIPFIDVTNPQDTSMGNPNLRPEFIHAAELSYSYPFGKSNQLLFSTYYQYTENLIQRYRRFNNDGTTFSQNRNLASGQTYGVEGTAKVNIKSWWDASLNVNGFRNIITGNNVDTGMNRSGWGGFAKLNTNIKFNKDFSGQITANYFAQTTIAQGFIKPYSNVDIALKKNFFKNLLTLTFNVSDVFNTLQTRTIYQQFPYYNQDVLRKNLTRTFGVTAQMRFASQSMRNNTDMPKAKPGFNKKEEKTKNRDENLKKDEGGGDEGGGNNNSNNSGGGGGR
ncbi:MAG: TonB-dependent receptor domain-containing protein [Chitinophagaceae bacterium]